MWLPWPWVSKKQWGEIYTQHVKPALKVAGKNLSIAAGKGLSIDVSQKRNTLESYREQMKRWSEWYQLSEIQRLGPKQALDKWLLEEDYADQWNPDEPFDLSTVTKAIDRFREIITPTPIKD